jgi:hypothetical protein
MTLLLALACSTPTAPPPNPRPAPAPAPAPAPSAPSAEPAPAPAPASSSSDAAAVIAKYYADLESHDYAAAWRLWEADGKASGKTLAQFKAGFTETAHTRVVVGTPGREEGAAGSSYVTIPVDVYATRKDGTEQHFTGTYSLRKANLTEPGQPAPTWELHSASLAVAK